GRRRAVGRRPRPLRRGRRRRWRLRRWRARYRRPRERRRTAGGSPRDDATRDSPAVRTTTTTAVLLLRHGQTTWNAERRWQGWEDAPLSPLGEQQARDAAAHLVDAGLTRVCSSDLSRARRTAELVADGLGFRGSVFVDAGLR